MPVWKHIIIHHSDTEDDAGLNDWAGIRRFHMSWRFDGEMVTRTRAGQLIAEGRKGVIPPWRDIGYHWGVEMVAGKLEFQRGRPMSMAGAHCEGMNGTSIGICCVGDFDKEPPSEPVYLSCAELCSNLIAAYPAITPWEIFPHRKFSQKTCPGAMFDMDRLVKYVKVRLGGR